MSNRIYPITKEQLDSGDYAIVKKFDVPKGYPNFRFQDKPFGKEIEGWDQKAAIDVLNSTIIGLACMTIAEKFDVPVREVAEGVREAEINQGPANLYSDEVYHLIKEATR